MCWFPVIMRLHLLLHAMLVDAWNEYVGSSARSRVACSAGSSLVTLIHAAELGPRTQQLIYTAILSTGALRTPVSPETAEMFGRFVGLRRIAELDVILASVLRVMTCIAEGQGTKSAVDRLEVAVRSELRPGAETEVGVVS